MRQHNTLTVRNFADVFRPILVVYALLFIFRLDWSFYDAASSSLYHPIGLFSVLGIKWPGLIAIWALVALAGGSGVLYVSGYLRKSTALVFTLSVFMLDGFHNMFGFVDAQIHMIFFLSALSVMEWQEDQPLFQNPAFRFCEIVFILVYFQSGVSKILDSGVDWALEGGTLQIGLIRQQVEMGLFFSRSAPFAIALSTAVLIFECFFPFLYWLNRRRAPLYLVSISFHIGTLLLMKIDFFHLWAFSLTMVIINVDWKGLYEARFKTAYARR